VLGEVADRPDIKHFILMCSAVNAIDASALESFEALNHRLKDAGVKFHLSEVKGPVMERLERSNVLAELSGKIWLSQNKAFNTLLRQEDSADRDAQIDAETPRGWI